MLMFFLIYFLFLNEVVWWLLFECRWEFDRKKLFERTSYMSSICNDLAHIVEVVNEFLYFLGPELKTVTGDVQGIDAIVHVRITTTLFLIQYPQIPQTKQQP